MPEEKIKVHICPNCMQPAIRAGNEITCEHCDAIFTITKKEGAKVKQLGPLEDHERRIRALEGKNKPKEPEIEQGGNNQDQDDESILPE